MTEEFLFLAVEGLCTPSDCSGLVSVLCNPRCLVVLMGYTASIRIF